MEVATALLSKRVYTDVVLAQSTDHCPALVLFNG